MILDPSSFIGSALNGVINLPVIIGLPSKTAPIPNFLIGVTPEESARGSVTIPSLQLSSGDLFLKSAVNGSEKTITFVISQDTIIPPGWLKILTTVIQNLSGILNSIGGGGLPNVSGISSNYVTSQLSALRNIKNGNQPILMLNSYITFQSIGQNNNNLSSNWYIEDYMIMREEADAGVTLQIKFRELLTKRDFILSPKSLITNFANEIISPALGSSIASLL